MRPDDPTFQETITPGTLDLATQKSLFRLLENQWSRIKRLKQQNAVLREELKEMDRKYNHDVVHFRIRAESGQVAFQNLIKTKTEWRKQGKAQADQNLQQEVKRLKARIASLSSPRYRLRNSPATLSTHFLEPQNIPTKQTAVPQSHASQQTDPPQIPSPSLPNEDDSPPDSQSDADTPHDLPTTASPFLPQHMPARPQNQTSLTPALTGIRKDNESPPRPAPPVSQIQPYACLPAVPPATPFFFSPPSVSPFVFNDSDLRMDVDISHALSIMKINTQPAAVAPEPPIKRYKRKAAEDSHDDLRCDECHYVCSRKTHLRRHKESQHKGC